MTDGTKTMRSDAAAPEMFTFEIYAGDERIHASGGRLQDVIRTAKTYARADRLDQISIYPEGSTVPARIFYRNEILVMHADGQV